MYNPYEDYREPSEVELIIHEAQQKLSDLVKPEVKEELNALNEQVDQLKAEKAILRHKNHSLAMELHTIRVDHEKEIKQLKSNFIRKVSKTLETEYWGVDYEQKRHDGNLITTANPAIQILEKVSKCEYFAEEKPMKYIESIRTDDGENIILTWNDGDDWYSKTELEIHDSFNLEVLKGKHSWRQVFKDEKDAQLYADYLNSLEKESITLEIVEESE